MSGKHDPQPGELWKRKASLYSESYPIHSLTDDGWVRFGKGLPLYCMPKEDFLRKFHRVDQSAYGLGSQPQPPAAGPGGSRLSDPLSPVEPGEFESGE